MAAGRQTDINAILRLLRKHFKSVEHIDETNVLPLVRLSLNERKAEKTEEYIRGKFSLGFEEFSQHGKTRLPDDSFRNAWAKIGIINLEARFIIAGFIEEMPTLVQTDEECGAFIHEDFIAIGEGAVLATSVLMQRDQSGIRNLSQSLYRVYEAKKYAEHVKSVGEETDMTTISESEKKPKRLTDEGLAILEAKYKKTGPQTVMKYDLPDSVWKDYSSIY